MLESARARRINKLIEMASREPWAKPIDNRDCEDCGQWWVGEDETCRDCRTRVIVTGRG